MLYRIMVLFLMLCAVGWGATLKVGVISDTHHDTVQSYTSFVGDDLCNPATGLSTNGYRIIGYAEASVGKAVTQFNTSAVDVALLDGDIVDDGDESAQYTLAVSSWATRSGYDVYPIIGNHETAGAGYSTANINLAYDELATLIPAGLDKLWWPSAVDDDTPVGYVKVVTVDGQDWCIIALPTVLNAADPDTVNGEWDNDGGGATAITLGDWFDDVALAYAETNGYPTIVMCHFPLYDTKTGDCFDDYTGMATQVSDLEDQSIPPVVIQGHFHATSGYAVKNEVVYIDLRGDTWDLDSSNTDRYSHGVLTLNYPAYVSPTTGKTKMQIKLDGYGNQVSFGWIDPIVAYYRFEDPNGVSAADSMRDCVGTNHLDPSAAIDIDAVGPFDSSNVYNVNKAWLLDGTVYADDTGGSPVSAFPVSVSMWLKVDTVAAEQCIVSFGTTGTTTRRASVYLTATGIPIMKTQGNIGETTTPTSTTQIDDNTWHHLVCVWEDSTHRYIYIDGARDVYTISGTEDFPATADWQVGGDDPFTTGVQSGLIGYLDELQVYSGVLTATEVKTLYDQGEKAFGFGSGSSGATHKGIYK